MLFGFEIFFEEFYDNWWGDGSANLDLKYHGQNIGVFTRRSLVFYEAFMSTACFLSLGGLCLWHARLIHAGQTSIEAHINRSEQKRLAELGKVYLNPYNFGPLHNWYLFLGKIGKSRLFILSLMKIIFLQGLSTAGAGSPLSFPQNTNLWGRVLHGTQSIAAALNLPTEILENRAFNLHKGCESCLNLSFMFNNNFKYILHILINKVCCPFTMSQHINVKSSEMI